MIFLAASNVQAETIVIAALGDSLTSGYGLPAEEGLVPQLQAWLDGQGVATEIRNAGVSGDTTAGGLSRVDWTLTPDVDAMILTLGANDYLRGFDPTVARENLSAILAKARATEVEVLLIGLNVGGNYGLEYKKSFDSIYPELAAEYHVAFYPAFFAGLLEAAGIQENVRELMQADGLHPNAKGVAAIVAAIGPDVQKLAQSVTK